ncbi:MAG: acetyl ornithine aminotransferase family protein [Acidobacteria bacterium]|nr:acetyl ornithine aminotransferase family protein [Acidobacteriota bacterium]
MPKNPWINISTPLPGPKAQAILEQDQKYVSPSYSRPYPLVAHKAEGMVVIDMDGNTFLDFAAGIAVCATGHCHPRIVRVIQEQAAQLIHLSGTDFYYPQLSALAQKLAEIAPGSGEKKVYFGNSGTEAIEAALKLARYATGRKKFIAFYGGFHGRTLGALSLTASKPVQRRGFGPLLEGVTHVPYPDCYRCPERPARDSCHPACVRVIEDQLFKTILSPEEVAAIVFEPIQGEGGYVVPPPEFFDELKRLSRQHGILLIADEVQSGMGRTGKMFAVEHFGIEPDIIALAKGIASGLPLGAIVARADLMSWPPGSHASTFGGNPVSCAAASETIRLLEEGLLQNAAETGQYLLDSLRKMMDRCAIIGDVRGRGLMIGIELVKDRNTKEKAGAWRDLAVRECFHKGLLILGCGENTLRLMPPLIVSRAQADVALEILEEVLLEIGGKDIV